MNWPPMLMHIKVKNKDTDFCIWIPFLLVMLVALVLILALSPFIILGFLIMLMAGAERYVRLTLWGFWAAIVSVWAMKGLNIEVKNFKEHVIVSAK
jgi:hypothetical protein